MEGGEKNTDFLWFHMKGRALFQRNLEFEMLDHDLVITVRDLVIERIFLIKCGALRGQKIFLHDKQCNVVFKEYNTEVKWIQAFG